ncbi:unnamed protein product [Brachionus calyciflorus]|uniref:Uncharacterized protein n=1 Tax=Brachionus calyciflorus TaxID=104777 RepID=A0A814J2X3_9BILA|nr:unnamed protein product [Brachionus calyciflorus]
MRNNFVNIFNLIILISFTSASKLIFISFDGFRHDYIEMYDLYNIKKLFLNEGVHIKNGLKNAFTTVTFPNHLTLATGLYPETHGIVANSMYDPNLNETFYAFTTKDNDTKWFAQNDLTNPIWTLNQLQNGKSAIIGGFPGANVPFKAQRPFYSEDYKNQLDWYEKINRIISLFSNNSINLGVLYFPEPDETGHEFGPMSNEIKKILRDIDLILGYLVIRLQDSGMDDVNIIVSSDHGMDTASFNKSIDLSDYIDVNLFKSYGGLTQINIFPNDMKNLDFIYESLKQIPNYNVFKRDQVPERFNYKQNERIGPIVMFGDVGYETFRANRSQFNWKSWKGDHGGDNDVLSMHPVFIARGPIFKKNFTLTKIVNSVDVYPLMCHILGLKYGVINGTLQNISHLLVDDYTFLNFGYMIDNLLNMAFIILFLFLLILFFRIKTEFVNNKNKFTFNSTTTRIF